MKMEITESKEKLLCELGDCRRQADFAVRFRGLPEGCSLRLCERCLRELSEGYRRLRRK